jgi:hypothetical protein
LGEVVDAGAGVDEVAKFAIRHHGRAQAKEESAQYLTGVDGEVSLLRRLVHTAASSFSESRDIPCPATQAAFSAPQEVPNSSRA